MLSYAVSAFGQNTNSSSNAVPFLGDIPQFHLTRSTNTLSDEQIEGQKLAKQLVQAMPAGDVTNAGVLHVRNGSGTRTDSVLTYGISIADSGWTVFYSTTLDLQKDRIENQLSIIHPSNGSTEYHFNVYSPAGPRKMDLMPSETMVPFANSDFWLCDLGLEFFHWPDQKIIKKEFARGRGCMVLESTNPDPTNGYSKVDCWIDEETLGIVHAEAFDPKGKKLKEFDPKSFKKVNGQWQLQDMEIRNVQTGSRTIIHFDLKAN